MIRVLPILMTIMCVGCSSHMIDLQYDHPGKLSKPEGIATVSVGGVVDSRGTVSNWLGAIRGGYGNPLKKLYTSQPTSDAVSAAFVEALQRRGLYEELKSAEFRLDIEIKKLDTSYYFNKEAHAAFIVDLIDTSSNDSVFRESYRTDNTRAGAGAGIFGDVSTLGEFANQTMVETIDKVLDDPRFRSALAESRRDPSSSLTKRLEELDRLRESGVISEDEYESQRRRILSEL